MAGTHFAATAGWEHSGSGNVVMLGTGRANQRELTSDKRAAFAHAIPTLGDATFDIWPHDRAFWRHVPTGAGNYRLGGYQVLKKWLSYRERSIPKRPLHPEEIQHFTDAAHRIAAIPLVTSTAAP